jgi:hypothetical protein
MNLHATAALALTAVLMIMGGFGIKEYDAFHDVLHPLEHEALPKGDFARIRSQAKELTKRGDAIVKLGVPNGLQAEKVDQFKKNLDEFSKALVKFSTDAESGTDADLKTSYSAVHDLFEELAHMLPQKSR